MSSCTCCLMVLSIQNRVLFVFTHPTTVEWSVVCSNLEITPITMSWLESPKLVSKSLMVPLIRRTGDPLNPTRHRLLRKHVIHLSVHQENEEMGKSSKQQYQNTRSIHFVHNYVSKLELGHHFNMEYMFDLN